MKIRSGFVSNSSSSSFILIGTNCSKVCQKAYEKHVEMGLDPENNQYDYGVFMKDNIRYVIEHKYSSLADEYTTTYSHVGIKISSSDGFNIDELIKELPSIRDEIVKALKKFDIDMDSKSIKLFDVESSNELK